MDIETSHSSPASKVSGDLAAGFALYLEIYIDGPWDGVTSPSVLKVPVTQGFMDHVRRCAEQVEALDAAFLKTLSFPGHEQTQGSDENCAYWGGDIAAEAFRFKPEEGPSGSTSPWVNLAEFESVTRGNLCQETFQWHAGSLLIRSAVTPWQVMVDAVESAFPSVKADRVAAEMRTTIQASLPADSPADQTLNATRANRARTV